MNTKDRIRAGLGFRYALTDWLDVTAHVNYDKDKQVQTQELYASTSYLLTQYGYSSLGEYGKINADLSQVYADFAFHLQKRQVTFLLMLCWGWHFAIENMNMVYREAVWYNQIFFS